MAQDRPQPLQDTFLKHVREHKVPVAVFLANGIRLQGTVTAFDSYSVWFCQGSRHCPWPTGLGRV